MAPACLRSSATAAGRINGRSATLWRAGCDDDLRATRNSGPVGFRYDESGVAASEGFAKRA